ncbi:MAG TPA: metal-dependent transcriptional regulator [Clostridiales bacterium]|jgi:Mn-dependent DtxR family transcriptional regulator|nr:metal-dependent transcriptional regulator [Clostridiales bacterium]
MIIRESGEMYLETILRLEKKGQVRSIDIVNATGYSKPTISEQMKKFRENGFIHMDERNFITLTDKGREIAEKIYERHLVLTDLFIDLGVDPETAEEDACRIEHYISDATFDKLTERYRERKKKMNS